MLKNWKHIAAVVWLVAVVALILSGENGPQDVAAVVLVAGLAVLYVRKWLASLKPAKSDG